MSEWQAETFDNGLYSYSIFENKILDSRLESSRSAAPHLRKSVWDADSRIICRR
jgi:hypothetical protein